MINHDPSIYEGIENEMPDELIAFESSLHPIFEQLVAETKPKTIVEVGCFYGASTVRWAQLAGPDCRIYGIDTWLGGFDQQNRPDVGYQLKRYRGYPNTYFQFLRNMKKHGVHNQVTPIPNTSVIGCLMLKAAGVTADLVYVDGSHDYKDALRDLCEYWPLVRPGGIMAFDDFSRFTGCFAAAWSFNEEFGLAKEMRLTEEKGIAWWKKP